MIAIAIYVLIGIAVGATLVLMLNSRKGGNE